MEYTASASGARELDISSGTFAASFQAGGACGWTEWRGLMLSQCPQANSLPQLLQAGQAAFETDYLAHTSYARAGPLSFNGSTAGMLPFTDIHTAATTNNSINVRDQIPVQDLNRIASKSSNLYNLTSTIQGLTADVSCQFTDSTPIVENATSGGLNLTIPCQPTWSLVQGGSSLRLSAAFCNATSTADPYMFYIHSQSYYAHRTSLSAPGPGLTEYLQVSDHLSGHVLLQR